MSDGHKETIEELLELKRKLTSGRCLEEWRCRGVEARAPRAVRGQVLVVLFSVSNKHSIPRLPIHSLILLLTHSLIPCFQQTPNPLFPTNTPNPLPLLRRRRMSDLVRLRLDRLQRVPHLRRDGLLLLTRPHNPHLLARPLALAHHRHGRVDSLLAPKRSVTHSRIAFPLCVVSLDQGVGRCL